MKHDITETEIEVIEEKPSKRSSEQGLSLVEVSMAMTLFALISLAVSLTLTRGVQHRQHSFYVYRAYSAVRDLLAEMQDTANRDQDLANQLGVGAIYEKYHGKTLPIVDVPMGEIAVTCFANEATVPAELGGPQDLNLDGDAADDLGNLSAGTDLKIVPMSLSVSFDVGGGQQTLLVHRLLTKTTD